MPRAPLEYNATLIWRRDIADGLALFRVKADGDPFQTFVPGQYIVLGMNHPEKGQVQRAYSIASPPSTLPGYFEFYIRYVEYPTSDNPLTHLLWTLKEGDRLYIGKKIVGKFTIHDEVGEEDPRLRICVAAGTGLAPFTSMVMEADRRGEDTGRFMVMHGARWPRELGYREEMDGLLNSGPARRYFCTISRDPGDEPWPADGYRGRVETLFDDEKVERVAAEAKLPGDFLDPANCVVFICGLNGTIASTMTKLFNRGFVPRDRLLRRELGIPDSVEPSLFFEQYDSDPVVDLKDPEVVRDCRDRLAHGGVPLLEEA